MTEERWELEGEAIIECSIDLQTFYINGIEVTQDNLIVELADCYDNQQTRDEMKDQELTEAAHKMFMVEHQVAIPLDGGW